MRGGMPTVLASLSTKGALPNGDLVLIGGTLYGTTVSGGKYGAGTVFSVPKTGGKITVLVSLNGNNGGGTEPLAGLILIGSNLYGTTIRGGANNQGTVFSVPTTGGTPTVLVSFDPMNGAHPVAGLIMSGSTLYGTTIRGGVNN